jgi:hypothetical protein
VRLSVQAAAGYGSVGGCYRNCCMLLLYLLLLLLLPSLPSPMNQQCAQ